MILIVLRAIKDDHDILDVGVVVVVLIVSFHLALIWAVALRCALVSLLGDLLLVCLIVLGQVIGKPWF